MESFNAACDDISKEAYDSKTFSKYSYSASSTTARAARLGCNLEIFRD
jgi:hypothetical protein